jgi:hypothetical protein
MEESSKTEKDYKSCTEAMYQTDRKSTHVTVTIPIHDLAVHMLKSLGGVKSMFEDNVLS